MTQPLAIETQDLVKTYPGGVRALDGMSFAVPRGTIFGLLGPNGAGKSTTIKVLTTLSRPNSGTARVADIDVLREPARVRRAIGCVSQKTAVDMESTGRENLTLQGRLYSMRDPELSRRVNDLLEQFALAKAADKVARTYSGGMQRKLDVAMGLIHRPEVLFLDEPTTGLDPEARSELWQEISWLAGEGLTILLTTHYLEEADRLAGKLAIVDRGRVVAEGTPEELKSELHGDAVYIEFGTGDFAGAPPESSIHEALKRVQGLTDVSVNCTSMRARAMQGATTVPPMLAAFEACGVKVASVTVSRPSLDDVYLRHAGRTFQQAEGGKR